MTMNRTRKAAFGLALLLTAGAAGTVSAHGMMDGGMPGGAQAQAPGSMMPNCPMMGGSQSMPGDDGHRGPQPKHHGSQNR